MTDKVHDLLQRSNRYLRSAELLLDDGDAESCVSRAYYAMFYAAEALLFSEGITVSTHRGVIGSFGEEFVKTGRLPPERGRDLSTVFQQRNVGEYAHRSVVSENEAGDALEKPRGFVADARTLLEGAG